MEKNILLGVIILCIMYFILNKSEHYENHIRSKYSSNMNTEVPVENKLVKGVIDRIIEKYNELFLNTLTCNFLYKITFNPVIINTPSTVLKGSSYTPSPPLLNGLVYINKLEANIYKFEFTAGDLNNNAGIIASLQNLKTLVITDGNTTYSFPIISQFADSSNRSISITASLVSLPDINTFFNSRIIYTVNPCNAPNIMDLSGTSSDSLSYFATIVINENIARSFYIFLGILVFIFLLINWRYIYNLGARVNPPPKATGGKYYYLGGYDNRDYSE